MYYAILLWSTISILFFSLPAFAHPLSVAPIALHPATSSPSIHAAWTSLENRNDAVELTYPKLEVELSSQELRPFWIRPRLSIVTNDQTITFALPYKFLSSKRETSFPISIPPKLLQLDKLRFSGKILLSLDVKPVSYRFEQASLERDGLTLPSLYFHPQGEKIKVYREDVLRRKYGSGNFQNLPLRVVDAQPEFRKVLAQTDLERIQPVLAFIHQSHSLPGLGDIEAPGLSRFCLAINGVAYLDSDFDEDFGRPGDLIPLARGWVAMGQQGNPIYTGFLDVNGCTPALSANREQEVSVAFFPLYLNTGPNIRGFVSDLNLGPEWPEGSMPYFLFFFEPENEDTTVVTVAPNEYIYTIFAAAANSMERARGGLSNVLYEFRLREAGDNAGTNTSYAAEGHPQVRIKYSPAAQEKFTISHEYGHALHIAKLNPPITPDDLDYSVASDEDPSNHTITSKEWQLTAAFEGFAHFISGIVWNEPLPDEGAVYGRGSEGFELDDFSRVFETNYDLVSHQGVEQDWAQFFWNYHTDLFETANGDVPPPSLTRILEMWLASYPWPANEGFYTDFRNGAQTVLQVFEPEISLEDSLERFDSIADSAGINH